MTSVSGSRTEIINQLIAKSGLSGSALEEYRPSTDVEGKFDIVRTDSNGKEYIVGLASHSINGETTIVEKTLYGVDNTKTDYFYAEGTDGGRMSYTKITDNDGNVLFENKFKFKKLDDNHYQSVENGITYDIEYTQGKIIVKNSNREMTEIPIIDHNLLSTYEEMLVDIDNFPHGVSDEIIQSVKKLDGSTLMSINKFGLKLLCISRDAAHKNNAQYNMLMHSILVSPERQNSDFILQHELGHYVDYSNDIHSNKELLEIYNQERDALVKNGSYQEFEEMAYFTSFNHINEGGAITEMIAETHALLSSSNGWDMIESRSALLQQYFPKTFAKIAQLLTAAKTSN